MEELVRRHSTIMDKYDPKKQVAMIVDEWGAWYATEPGTHPRFLYQQNSIRDAVLAAIHLDIFNNHADRVRMANIAQTINVLQAMILTDQEKMILTPTYHVFEMYTVHQDATQVPIFLESAEYAYGDYSFPTVSASASVDAHAKLHITLSNAHPREAQTVTIYANGIKASQLSGRIVTADVLDAHNTFDNPHVVTPQPFHGAQLDGEAITVTLPKMSVVVLEIA
jgi:alpha-N-arabinofuranosidase